MPNLEAFEFEVRSFRDSDLLIDDLDLDDNVPIPLMNCKRLQKLVIRDHWYSEAHYSISESALRMLCDACPQLQLLHCRRSRYDGITLQSILSNTDDTRDTPGGMTSGMLRHFAESLPQLTVLPT